MVISDMDMAAMWSTRTIFITFYSLNMATTCPGLSEEKSFENVKSCDIETKVKKYSMNLTLIYIYMCVCCVCVCVCVCVCSLIR